MFTDNRIEQNELDTMLAEVRGDLLHQYYPRLTNKLQRTCAKALMLSAGLPDTLWRTLLW